ncbi:MAG: hypothetical protein ACJATI_001099 [Halioglobus sp.]
MNISNPPVTTLAAQSFPGCYSINGLTGALYNIQIVGPEVDDGVNGDDTYSTGCFTGQSFFVTIDGKCPIKTNPVVSGICEGEEGDPLSIELNLEGGEEPYFISWSNGEFGTSITNLEPKQYTVTVEDANGCMITDIIPVEYDGSNFGYSYEVLPMVDVFEAKVKITILNKYPPITIVSSGAMHETIIIDNGETAVFDIGGLGVLLVPSNLDLHLDITNNSGCKEAIDITVADCRSGAHEEMKCVITNVDNELNIKIKDLEGGVPPYDVHIERIKENNDGVESEVVSIHEIFGNGGTKLISVPLIGKYKVIVLDQCKSRIEDIEYIPNKSSVCDFSIHNDINENTHYIYPISETGNNTNHQIVFEAICGCNDQCSGIGGKDPFIDIKNINLNSTWGTVTITWPVISGYENDDNTEITTYWNDNGLQHNGREHFSLGKYLDDKVGPIDPLIVKVEFSNKDCVLEIPMTFSPSSGGGELTFLQIKESDISGTNYFEDKGYDQIDLIMKSAYKNYSCEDCYTTGGGVSFNDGCNVPSQNFTFNPNDEDNPCYGGGILKAYDIMEDGSISKRSIIVKAGVAIKEYEDDIMGHFLSDGLYNDCEKGGMCIFSSIDIFNFPVEKDEDVPINILASYCINGTEIDDPDNDFVDTQNDNCPYIANGNQADWDGDGRGDACDNCPKDFNPNQNDNDQDGKGDVCDLWDWNIVIIGGSGISDVTDSDGDGIADVTDNCPTIPNTDQADEDDDQIGDVCECDLLERIDGVFAGPGQYSNYRMCRFYESCEGETQDYTEVYDESLSYVCLEVLGNSPNPFVNSTNIEFNAPMDGSVEFWLYESDEDNDQGLPLYNTSPVFCSEGFNSIELNNNASYEGYMYVKVKFNSPSPQADPVGVGNGLVYHFGMIAANTNDVVLSLINNSPNPFSGLTTINYQVPYAGESLFTFTNDNTGVILGTKTITEQFEGLKELEISKYVELNGYNGIVIVDLDFTSINDDTYSAYPPIEILSINGFKDNNDDNSVRSEDTDKIFDVNVYPNPTSGALNFSSYKVITSITLYNTQGKEVLVLMDVNSTNKSLDLNHLPHGLYISRIISATNEVLVKRIVIQ